MKIVHELPEGPARDNELARSQAANSAECLVQAGQPGGSAPRSGPRQVSPTGKPPRHARLSA